MKKTVIMLFLTVISLVAYSQSNTINGGAKFKESALESAYHHYIQLKNALVATNQKEAKLAIDELVKSIANVNGGSKVLEESKKLAQANTIELQRKAFTQLSNEMIKLVKNAEISSGELYLEYCPMANGNTGGYWLSNEKEIRNPYFGDKMLKCGSVKETIK